MTKNVHAYFSKGKNADGSNMKDVCYIWDRLFGTDGEWINIIYYLEGVRE